MFELEGRPVRRGDRLFVAPGYFQRAGPQVTAIVEARDGQLTVRSQSGGAVATLPVNALSWEPHPDTVDMETMQLQGIDRPTPELLKVWRRGRDQNNRSKHQTRLSGRKEHIFAVEYLLSGKTPAELLVARKLDEALWVRDYARMGPNPDMAMTDPALFVRLRNAITNLMIKGWV